MNQTINFDPYKAIFERMLEDVQPMSELNYILAKSDTHLGMKRVGENNNAKWYRELYKQYATKIRPKAKEHRKVRSSSVNRRDVRAVLKKLALGKMSKSSFVPDLFMIADRELGYLEGEYEGCYFPPCVDAHGNEIAKDILEIIRTFETQGLNFDPEFFEGLELIQSVEIRVYHPGGKYIYTREGFVLLHENIERVRKEINKDFFEIMD